MWHLLTGIIGVEHYGDTGFNMTFINFILNKIEQLPQSVWQKATTNCILPMFACSRHVQVYVGKAQKQVKWK